MSQTNAYRVLEYPDGTGSNPVKKKKIYFLFIALLSISFVVAYVLNITINIFSHISMVNHHTTVFLDRLLWIGLAGLCVCVLSHSYSLCTRLNNTDEHIQIHSLVKIFMAYLCDKYQVSMSRFICFLFICIICQLATKQIHNWNKSPW